MNQNDLLDAAKQHAGLTSDYKLAQRLGVSSGRISDLRSGHRTPDDAELFMLADMAKIDAKIAAAVVRKDTEKNPVKRAYWEKISTQFALASVAAATVVVEKISGNFEYLLSRYSPRPA